MIIGVNFGLQMFKTGKQGAKDFIRTGGTMSDIFLHRSILMINLLSKRYTVLY